MISKGRQRTTTILLFCAGVAFCCVLLVRSFVSGKREFQIPTVGTFVGFITLEGDSKEKFPLLIHRSSIKPEILTIIGGSLGSFDRFPLSLNGPRALEPLTLGSGRVVLSTDPEDPGLSGMQGEAMIESSKSRGLWRVTPTEVANLAGAPNLAKWVAAYVKLNQSSEAVNKDQADVASLRAERDRLNRLVVERPDFREAAQSRLGKTSNSLETTKASLLTLRAELIPLERQLQVASRVTANGKLVELARESMDRDSEWILAALQKVSPEISKDFERALEKGRRVTELRDQIKAEQAAIDAIHLQRDQAAFEREADDEEEEVSEPVL